MWYHGLGWALLCAVRKLPYPTLPGKGNKGTIVPDIQWRIGHVPITVSYTLKGAPNEIGKTQFSYM